MGFMNKELWKMKIHAITLLYHDLCSDPQGFSEPKPKCITTTN